MIYKRVERFWKKKSTIIVIVDGAIGAILKVLINIWMFLMYCTFHHKFSKTHFFARKFQHTTMIIPWPLVRIQIKKKSYSMI